MFFIDLWVFVLNVVWFLNSCNEAKEGKEKLPMYSRTRARSRERVVGVGVLSWLLLLLIMMASAAQVYASSENSPQLKSAREEFEKVKKKRKSLLASCTFSPREKMPLYSLMFHRV